MKIKSAVIIVSSVFASAVLTGCGDKEDGTKYEYAENLIYEQDESSVKLLNSTESETELKLNFSFENFETEDVKIKVYDPEEKEITEGVECAYDEEKSTVSIKGDVSQIETAEVSLNSQTSVKLKSLKEEAFKYLVTNYDDDYGCTYLGDLDDFKLSLADDNPDESSDTEDNSQSEDQSNLITVTDNRKTSVSSHMKKDEIFELLRGKWVSEKGDFSLEFSDNSSGDCYKVKASGTGADEYDSEVSYFDETKTEEGDHKIRFVTSQSSYGSCRELILSDDGKTLSYITGIQKNENDEFEEVYVICHRS